MAPRSMSNIAMSNWPLITAISSGLVAVAGADLVDVGAAVEQRARGFDVALPRGVQQRRQAALGWRPAG